MTLIVILAALACERLLSHVRRWRTYDWYGRYLGRLRGVGLCARLWHSPWGLLLLTPPLAVVGVLQSLLHGGVWDLVGLLFAASVLVFALGPRDLWEQVHALIAARGAGHAQGVESLARDLRANASVAVTQVGKDLLRATILQGHERVFGVLLWFMVLGPLGALGYRLVAASPGHFRALDAGEALREAAERLHALAAWAPQRLTLILYGLAGSTDGALAGWRRVRAAPREHWVWQGWRMLAETGYGALQVEAGRDHHRLIPEGDEALRQALGMITRSLILLLAGLAAFTIGGWVA